MEFLKHLGANWQQAQFKNKQQKKTKKKNPSYFDSQAEQLDKLERLHVNWDSRSSK